MRYSKEQIDCLKKYYPDSNYEEIFKLFPQKTKKQIKGIAHYYNIKSSNPGHALDLSQQRFGRLVAIDIIRKENGKVYWKCQCDCGNTTTVIASCLVSGKTKSCGCLAKESTISRSSIDHTGKRFGMLVAEKRYPRYNGGTKTYYLCQCDCGNKKVISGSSLVSGKTISCGCISKRIDYWKIKNGPIADSRLYIVYMHTAPNGKVYVGITKQNTEKRWQNGYGYASQQLFWRAIQKYGWDNFQHTVLESNLEIEKAFEREEYYIAKYDSLNPERGYNVHKGGTSGRTLVTPVMQYWRGIPVNFFESISVAAKELGVNSGTIRNYIASEDLPDSYSFDRLPEIHTYDIDENLYLIRNEYHYRIVQLMKETKAEKTITRNKSTVRKINQYTMDGKYLKTWDSIAEARRSCSGLSSISAALSGRGNSKSAGGFLWKYDTGDHSDIETVAITYRRKAVIQIDATTGEFIQEFISAAEAERYTGIKRALIGKCCSGTSKTAGGYIWKYKENN